MPGGAPAAFGAAGSLIEGVALPISLSGLYVIAVRFAGEIGTGNVTSFSYAYLIASALVALTSSPLSLVSSVPLTRRGVGTTAPPST